MPETPLIKKLGIKPGQKILILNAPQDYLQQLEILTEAVKLKTTTGEAGTFDFVQLFVQNKSDIDNHAGTAIEALKKGGLLWFTYPKKSSKVKTDITRDHGWESVRSSGWRPVTQIAIDEIWSALRFRPESEVK